MMFIGFHIREQILYVPFIPYEIINGVVGEKNHPYFNSTLKSIRFGRWDFLDDILVKIWFGDNPMETLIQNCLNIDKGSILVNGSPTEEFQFYKGLKQGPFMVLRGLESLMWEGVYDLSGPPILQEVERKFTESSGVTIFYYTRIKNRKVETIRVFERQIAIRKVVLKECFPSGVSVKLFGSDWMLNVFCIHSLRDGLNLCSLRWLGKYVLVNVENVMYLLKHGTLGWYPYRLQQILKAVFEGIFYCLWWSFWMFRNKILFEKDTPSQARIFDNIVSNSYYW
ncbi:hypothetical protein Tco_0807193, partial [Tanacetum coccineum]